MFWLALSVSFEYLCYGSMAKSTDVRFWRINTVTALKELILLVHRKTALVQRLVFVIDNSVKRSDIIGQPFEWLLGENNVI